MNKRNISAYPYSPILDNNEIPKATPTLSGFRNTVILVCIISDVGVTGKPNMAAINRKYICNVVYLGTYT